MVSSVAVGSVILGDKEDKTKTDMINEGCAVDLAELEGDLFRFGSTEEAYRVKILGCRRRGRKRDGDFNRHDGKGYVPEVPGDYHDAIFKKKVNVIPMIVGRHQPPRPRLHRAPPSEDAR